MKKSTIQWPIIGSNTALVVISVTFRRKRLTAVRKEQGKKGERTRKKYNSECGRRGVDQNEKRQQFISPRLCMYSSGRDQERGV